MVISHITKAIAKASAKKMAKNANTKGSLNIKKNKTQLLKKKVGRNIKKKYHESNKDKIKDKYDQDAHVKANRDFQLDDIDRRHDGLARFDRLTGRLVDPDDTHAIHSQDIDDYTGIEGRLSPGSALQKKKILDARRLKIQKRETEREAHLMGSSDPTDSTIPKKKANLAQYHSSNKKFGKAKSVEEMTHNERMDGYQGFESPNKIKIVSRDSYTGKQIKNKGAVNIKPVYHEVTSEPFWKGGIKPDFERYMQGGDAPPGFVRASYPDEPAPFGFIRKQFATPTPTWGNIRKQRVEMDKIKQTTKYQKSLKANKFKSKIKNKIKKFNEVDPVTGGYAHFGFGSGNKKKTSPPGKLKKFWDDWLFPQD